jgi:WD40 repeat protein
MGTTRVSIAELLETGVTLQPHEAVAIARAVVTCPSSSEPTASAAPRLYGPVSLENVELTVDGRVECTQSAATPAVSEVAIFLQAMLPPGLRAPGGLRYAIGRALLEVEAPPFDSIHEFSRALARYEQGDRDEVLRSLLERAGFARPAALTSPRQDARRQPRAAGEDAAGGFPVAPSPSMVERRSSAARVDELRRQLREADRHAFERAAPIAAAVPARAPYSWRWPAVAAGIAVAVALLAGGGILRTYRTSDRVAATTPARHLAASSSPTGTAGSAFFDPDLRLVSIDDQGAHDYHVQRSPKGDRLAFDSDRDGVRGVYVADRDGTHVRRVSGPGYAASPAWSPDGGELAFVRSDSRDPGVSNLWVLSLADGRTRQLTDYQTGHTTGASFSGVRGGRICYAHDDAIVVLDVRTGRTRAFDSPMPGRAVGTLAMSPDGTKVVFDVEHHGAWLLALADGTMRRVLPDPTADQFAWAPDSRRVAFHSRRDNKWSIYVTAE